MAAESPPAKLISSGPEIGPDSPWALRILLPVFGTLLCLIAVALATELHLKLGYEIFTEQGLAAIFGLALTVIYLKLPAGRKGERHSIPWYDVLLATVSFCVGAYLAVRYPLLQDELFERRGAHLVAE